VRVVPEVFGVGLGLLDGVPPGGVGDQGTGIRRSGTVAPPDRVFNPLQREASRTAASTEIVMSLEPERAALDPLHHVVGHDRLLALGLGAVAGAGVLFPRAGDPWSEWVRLAADKRTQPW
jgi:hypothetical protein